MVTHSQTSPSRLERILNCPGSVQATAICQEGPTSEYAQEGSLLHRATDEASNLGIDAITYIDTDGRNAVLDCLEYEQSVINSIGHRDYTISHEIPVSLTSWGIPEVYGTLDSGIMDKKNRHAHILDWKFGRGVQVFALWNPQLLSYGAGFIKGDPPVADKLTLHIVQPRIDHYDRWTVDLPDLTSWVREDLAKAIALSQSKNPPLIPGEKQCRWCEARNQCPAIYKQRQQDAKLLFQAAQNIELIDNREIAKVLRVIPRLNDYMKTVQVYAQQELQRGRGVPGYKLIAGRSNRAWAVSEDKIVKWLGENSSIDDIFVSKLVSCAQAEKEDRSLKKNAEFHKLIVKPEGKPTVVPDTDRRPELEPSSTAINVFRDIDI